MSRDSDVQYLGDPGRHEDEIEDEAYWGRRVDTEGRDASTFSSGESCVADGSTADR